MTNRITGTNSGIDVDSVVKQSLSAEQTKIDKAYQQQKVYEYQQEQLKEIVSDAQDFYDKYLDILSSDSLLRSSKYETASFTSVDSTGASTTAVTATGYAGADISNDYKVTVTQLASKATEKITSEQLKSSEKITIRVKIKNKDEDIEGIIYYKDDNSTIDMEKTAKELNSSLKSKGANVTAKYSEFAKGIVIESGETGEGASFSYSTTSTEFTEVKGQNAKGTISKGNESVEINSSTNLMTVDNVKFTFNSVTNDDGVTLTGKTDISNLKDTIVNFINDYNKLIETINAKLWEKRDTDYMPLTDEQKEEMSDSEIESWEKKAKTGLLRNDSDLSRIKNSMKSIMSSLVEGTGLTLESIGIEPVDNYTTKNGMFTIDEDKLTEALTNNAEEVKDFFTRASVTEKKSDGTTEVTEKGGILTQLQSVIKSEFKSSSSSLSKRIGFEGTATEKSNTLSNYITKQKSLIEELKEKYSDKETALYKKYSNLETMLEKLNAQTNSLYSMLGIS